MIAPEWIYPQMPQMTQMTTRYAATAPAAQRPASGCSKRSESCRAQSGACGEAVQKSGRIYVNLQNLRIDSLA
jgi:hypothetical protein